MIDAQRKKEIEARKRGRPPIVIPESDNRIRERIEKSICLRTGVSPEDLAHESKVRVVSYARDLYCYFLRNRTNYPLSKIGNLINRKHNTVIDSVNNIKEQASVYPKVREDIRIIDEMVKFVGISIG